MRHDLAVIHPVMPQFRHSPIFNSGLIKLRHDRVSSRDGATQKGRQRLRHLTAPASFGLRVATSFLIALSLALPAGQAAARESDRTLRLYFAHTGERAEFTFKRNGRYDRRELDRINTFLRDWRKNEPAKMDPQLLDLVWSIYRETGSRDYVHVVSAYRSPGTNEALRKRSSGVAKNSQHTQGKAMDFFIPGVPLDKLRAIAMKKQGGGVGYYPKSGSPFVHADTGSVRAWPRMSRSQLLALFPNGDTLHLPADGKPLPGHERALARGKPAAATTEVAYLDEESATPTGERRGVGRWLKRVFDGGADEMEDDVASGLPIPTAPQPLAPAVADPQILMGALDGGIEPRLPRARPGSDVELALAELRPTTDVPAQDFAAATLAFAPLPRTRPDPTMLAESLDPVASDAPALDAPAEDAIAAFLSTQEPAPPAAPIVATPARDTAIDAVQLAFAAAEETVGVSPADNAIIAGFAANSQAAPPAQPQQAAPLQVAAVDAGGANDSGPIGVIFAAADLVSSASAATAPIPDVAQPASGYSDDANDMLDLVAAPESRDEGVTELAMPMPEGAPGLYAPAATMKVEGLDGGSALPADRFAAVAPQPDKSEGFFSKLFLSLVR
jgi:uncharacterized protein YcbK (DUF882 family)